MKDFLRGMFGRFLQIVLAVLCIILIFSGFFAYSAGGASQTVLGWVLFVLGILCGCAVFGIRYWLSSVVRIR